MLWSCGPAPRGSDSDAGVFHVVLGFGGSWRLEHDGSFLRRLRFGGSLRLERRRVRTGWRTVLIRGGVRGKQQAIGHRRLMRAVLHGVLDAGPEGKIKIKMLC